MKHEEITHGNLLIGQFMEARPSIELSAFSNRSFVWVGNNIAKYEKEWDWLMPVVEKIESIENSDDYEIDIFGNCCDIGGKIEKVGKTKIEAVWLAVVEFIKWYNNNK